MASNSNELLKRISVNKEICGGRPCISGTRIRISDILEMIADGMQNNEILEEFPQLSEQDIKASLKFASQATSHKIIKAA